MRKYTEKQIQKALKETLNLADQERKSAQEIRESFGECGAFQASFWTAYGIEFAMEDFLYALNKSEPRFRNGFRE